MNYYFLGFLISLACVFYILACVYDNKTDYQKEYNESLPQVNGILIKKYNESNNLHFVIDTNITDVDVDKVSNTAFEMTTIGSKVSIITYNGSFMLSTNVWLFE
jgi:hypothetical protein